MALNGVMMNKTIIAIIIVLAVAAVAAIFAFGIKPASHQVPPANANNTGQATTVPINSGSTKNATPAQQNYTSPANQTFNSTFNSISNSTLPNPRFNGTPVEPPAQNASLLSNGKIPAQP